MADVDRVVTGFLAYLVEMDCVNGTIQGYRANLTGFFSWFAGQGVGQVETLAHVTPLDVREYRRHLQDEGYKPGTINKKLSCLRRFFDWCIDDGQTAANPLTHIKGVDEMPRAPRWLDRKETYRILRTAVRAVQLAEIKGLDASLVTAVRTWATAVLMLNAGLRVSEVCNLRLADVQLKPRSGQAIIQRGKGNKYREVPLNLDTRRAISRWLEVRQSDTPYLFVTQQGRMTRQLVQWHISKLGQQAGVHLSPHILRHTFGKNLVDAGVSLDRVAMLMGHSDVNTTAIYTMPGQADLREAVDLIAWAD